jgi:hypothetical protein
VALYSTGICGIKDGAFSNLVNLDVQFLDEGVDVFELPDVGVLR